MAVVASLALRSLSDHTSSLCQSSSMQSIDRTDMNWKLPRHSWDTHVHVFDPANYPYAEPRAYTPETATYAQLLAFNANLTVSETPQNIVLVQPSPYGYDNSAILASLRNHSKSSDCDQRQLRAITVFDPEKVTEGELKDWDRLGVRGFRINTEASGNQTAYEEVSDRIRKTAERVISAGLKHWKCQLYISGVDWDHLYDTLKDLPLKVIADHQGGMKGTSALANGTATTTQPGFRSLLSLANQDKVIVKISALYRSSKLTTGGYDDVEPLIRTLADQVPDQLIWASDWPHTGSGTNRTAATKYLPEKFRVVDDVAILKNIVKWVGEEVFCRMTVQTPAKVYA